MDTSIVRIPAQGALDVRFERDPRQATKKSSRKTPGGFDYLHHLHGGGMIYLDPATHEAVLQSGAAAGDTVRLTKVRRGQQTSVEVELLSEATEPAPAAPTPIRREPASAAPYVAGAAAPQIQPQPLPAEEGAVLNRPFAKEAVGAFLAAYDVLSYIERYAVAKGRPVVFTAEDFRATAISFHISMRGGN